MIFWVHIFNNDYRGICMDSLFEKIIKRLQRYNKKRTIYVVVIIIGVFDLFSVFNVHDTFSIVGSIFLVIVYIFICATLKSKQKIIKVINNFYLVILILMLYFSTFFGHCFYPIKYVIDTYKYNHTQFMKSEELARYFYLLSQENFDQSADMLPIEGMEVWEIANYNFADRIEELDDVVSEMNQETMLSSNIISLYLLSRIPLILNGDRQSAKNLKEYTSELMESVSVVSGYVKTAYLVSLAELGELSVIENFLQTETIEIEESYLVRNAQASSWLYLYYKLEEWESPYSVQCLANAFACDRIFTSDELFRRHFRLMGIALCEVEYDKIKECREKYDVVFESYTSLDDEEFTKYLEYGMHIGSCKALEYKLKYKYNKNDMYIQNVLQQIQKTGEEYFSFGIFDNGTIVGLHSIVSAFSEEATQTHIQFSISIIDDKNSRLITQQNGWMIYNIDLDCFGDIFVLKFSEDENEHYLRLKMYNLQLDRFIDLNIPQPISKLAYRANGYNVKWKGGTVEVSWYGEEEIESYIEDMRVYVNAQIIYDTSGTVIDTSYEYVNSAIEYFAKQGRLQLQFQNFIENGWIKDKDFLQYIKEKNVLSFKKTWLEEVYLGFLDFIQPDYSAMIFYFSDGNNLWVEDKYYLLLYRCDKEGAVNIVNIYRIYNYGSSTWSLSKPIVNIP